MNGWGKLIPFVILLVAAATVLILLDSQARSRDDCRRARERDQSLNRVLIKIDAWGSARDAPTSSEGRKMFAVIAEEQLNLQARALRDC